MCEFGTRLLDNEKYDPLLRYTSPNVTYKRDHFNHIASFVRYISFMTQLTNF